MLIYLASTYGDVGVCTGVDFGENLLIVLILVVILLINALVVLKWLLIMLLNKMCCANNSGAFYLEFSFIILYSYISIPV